MRRRRPFVVTLGMHLDDIEGFQRIDGSQDEQLVAKRVISRMGVHCAVTDSGLGPRNGWNRIEGRREVSPIES